MALLVGWLRDDVLTLAGPDHTTRCELFDFIVAELRLCEPLCPNRITPSSGASLFQSTPARGGRRDRNVLNDKDLKVSIHARPRRATYSAASPIAGSQGFNPRPPAAGDWRTAARASA